MITVITTVLGVFFKLAQFAARVALNRTTVILTFVASIGVTISLIYQSLTDVDGYLSQALASLSAANLTISDWVASNEYLQLIGYALSLDSLISGCVSTFLFIVCTLAGFLFTAAFGVFVAVLPLLADLAVSAIKHQMSASISGLGK